MSIEPSYLFWLLFSVYNVGYVTFYNTLASDNWVIRMWRYTVALAFGPLYTLVALLYLQQVSNVRAQVIKILDSEDKET